MNNYTWTVKRKYNTGDAQRGVPGVDIAKPHQDILIIPAYTGYATFDEQHITKNIHDGEYGDTYYGNIIFFGTKTDLIRVGDVLNDMYIVVTIEKFRRVNKLYLERLR